MILSRDNFAQLLTPIHRQIFFDEFIDMDIQYPEVCSLDEMRKAQETYQHESTFGLWDENTEGNTINLDEINEGLTATLSARRFDKGYSITWEAIQDDLYNVLSGYGQGNSAQGLAKGLHQTIEKQIAAIYINGFSSVQYDGVPFFSASHPLANAKGSALNSNLATGALTPDNLKAALTLLRDTRDEAGLKIMARADQLVVGQNLEWTANEILSSAKQAGEFSNTANVLPNMDIMVLDYIDGSVTYPNMWAVRDTRKKNVVHAWREKPIFDSQVIPRTVDRFFYGYARWDNGVVNYRGAVASTGV